MMSALVCVEKVVPAGGGCAVTVAGMQVAMIMICVATSHGCSYVVCFPRWSSSFIVTNIISADSIWDIVTK